MKEKKVSDPWCLDLHTELSVDLYCYAYQGMTVT